MEDNRWSGKSEEQPEAQEAENLGRSSENRKKHTRPKRGERNRKAQPKPQQAKNEEEDLKQATVAIARGKEL